MFGISPSPVTALTDDTLALQNAINKMDEVQLSAGTFIVSETVWIKGKAGFVLRGSGKSIGSGAQGTKILWRGNSTDPLFRLSNSRDCAFENLSVVSSSDFPLTAAFLSENPLGGAFATTGNLFRDLYLDGTSANGLQKGFQFASDNDANNDASRFERVFVNNYTIAAWSFEHPQSKAHAFFGCEFSGNQIGQYGVTTGLGVNSCGGSFCWYGGNGGGNTTADFYLGAANDPIFISCASCESSDRFLINAGLTGASWPVCLYCCRFSADKLNADGKAVIFQSPGPLSVISCQFGDGNSIPLEIDLDLTGGASSGYGVAIGNRIFSSLLHPFAAANATWSLTANVNALNNANTLIS